jgi:DNA-binding Lrp family transcriptional regulator
MVELLDGQILHALQLSPRVSFRRIAEVLDVPEQTVARRYRKLRRDGVVRVVGLIDPRVHGECQWVVRVHAKPDDLPRLADALVRRPDVTHANVLSGWTELVCVIRAPLGESSDGLLQRLPRTSSVLGLDINLVLHLFGEPARAQWTAYGNTLSDDQSTHILRSAEGVDPPSRPTIPTDEDQALLEALAEDGRAPHARLAEQTGWSPARVKRRIAALEAAGTLIYDVDLLPERLGFNLNAILWLTIAPRHLASVGEQIAVHHEIASVIAVSGRNNVMAVVICRDADHLYSYLAERLATIEHIQNYDISIRARRLKQAASLIRHGRLIQAGR